MSSPSIVEIRRAVCEHYGINELDVISRRRDVARPRQIAMYLAHEFTTLPLARIGGAFAGRDHTTVMHAIATIKRLRESDQHIGVDIKQIIRLLGREQNDTRHSAYRAGFVAGFRTAMKQRAVA